MKALNKLNPRIVTVTLNPVLDKTLWIKDFSAGKTFQVEKSVSVAGGKGVNVSRALQAFGKESLATGIMAKGGCEPYINLLNANHIAHDFLNVNGDLRTNITILSGSVPGETHLRDRGPVLNIEAFVKFRKKMRGLGNKNIFFVFSGSLPIGLPDDTYHTLISMVKGEAYFDASGTALKKGLNAKPSFIKPNAHEVKDALGFFPESRNEFLKAINIFHEMGIKKIMISLGKKGLIFFQGKDIVHARLHITNPVNTVGSGDASLAGGLIGIITEFDTADTARLACAMGAANTLVSGACIFNTDDVENLFDKVTITLL